MVFNFPKTAVELENWMKANCYNQMSYSINGNLIFEGFGIEKKGEYYVWYYTERGQRNDLKHFSTEEDAIAYAYQQIKDDKWAKSHCIGFTKSKNKSAALANKLSSMGIEYFQDEIPKYGPLSSVFRTFVFGCSIKQVANLKEKYYETS